MPIRLRRSQQLCSRYLHKNLNYVTKRRLNTIDEDYLWTLVPLGNKYDYAMHGSFHIYDYIVVLRNAE